MRFIHTSIKFRVTFLIPFLLLFLFSANPVHAQLIRLSSAVPDTLIAGSLKDSKGLAITNTTIQLRNYHHHVIESTTTNSNGEFVFNITVRNANDNYLSLLDKTVALQDLIALKESEQDGETFSINLRTKIETPHNKMNNSQIRNLPSSRTSDVINTLDGQGALDR